MWSEYLFVCYCFVLAYYNLKTFLEYLLDITNKKWNIGTYIMICLKDIVNVQKLFSYKLLQ